MFYFLHSFFLSDFSALSVNYKQTLIKVFWLKIIFLRARLVDRCGLLRRGSREDFARATELSSSSLLICWSSWAYTLLEFQDILTVKGHAIFPKIVSATQWCLTGPIWANLNLHQLAKGDLISESFSNPKKLVPNHNSEYRVRQLKLIHFRQTFFHD